jgi:hypothetical protein
MMKISLMRATTKMQRSTAIRRLQQSMIERRRPAHGEEPPAAMTSECCPASGQARVYTSAPSDPSTPSWRGLAPNLMASSGMATTKTPVALFRISARAQRSEGRRVTRGLPARCARWGKT